MLLTGDVAIYINDHFHFVGFPSYLHSLPMCINLEGAINASQTDYKRCVFNCINGIESLSEFCLSHPFVANNHIHDVPNGLAITREHYEVKGLTLVGDTVSDEPIIFHSNEYKYGLLGFGWSVIGCVNGEKGGGVNPLERSIVIEQVKRALKNHSNTRIVVVIHGNYEFEPYPQPGHRRLALDLVDLGVYSVIFHHPHIVGPIERYKNRTIAYSLGNFAFSHGKFFDGKLSFPERSFHQVIIELGDEDFIHHCNFTPPSTVSYNYREPVHSSRCSLKAEFEGFSDHEYLRWFKENRHKKRLLPIYKSSDYNVSNFMKDKFVLVRQNVIDFFVWCGIKNVRRR